MTYLASNSNGVDGHFDINATLTDLTSLSNDKIGNIKDEQSSTDTNKSQPLEICKVRI